MIIGFSGKKQSGKDESIRIIQRLTDHYADRGFSPWQVKRFAYGVKQVVSIRTGLTMEQLEDADVKENVFVNYKTGEIKHRKEISLDGIVFLVETVNQFKQYDKDIDFPTVQFWILVRVLLQYEGTDIGRKFYGENCWVNSMMSGYKEQNWLIADVRFPNETKAITDRGGIVIRINRDWKVAFRTKLEAELPDESYVLGDDIPAKSGERSVIAHTGKQGKILYEIALEEEMRNLIPEHASEKGLDDYIADFTINNNGTLEDLTTKLENILYTLGILKPIKI